MNLVEITRFYLIFSRDQNLLVYPFYSVLVYGPFIFIEYTVARAMFMTLLQAAVLGVDVLLDIENLLRGRALDGAPRHLAAAAPRTNSEGSESLDAAAPRGS